MTTFDTEAQCLISDSAGQLYLCPRYKRDDAGKYFFAQRPPSSDAVTHALPVFLKAVPSLDTFHFYRAFFEDGNQPSSVLADALTDEGGPWDGVIEQMKKNPVDCGDLSNSKTK